MRLGSDLLRSTIETTVKILDKQGKMPNAPEEFGSKAISELIDDGTVVVNIDNKYPQALGINQIMDRVRIWGNSSWDLIHNGDQASPFFTSDFASAIEVSNDPRILNRLVPLAPDFAIRIRPDLNARHRQCDHSFPAFRYQTLRPDNSGIRKINAAIVQCAEGLVFFRDQREWSARFLEKNRHYWIEPNTTQIPVNKGFMNVSTMRIKRKPPEG